MMDPIQTKYRKHLRKPPRKPRFLSESYHPPPTLANLTAFHSNDQETDTTPMNPNASPLFLLQTRSRSPPARIKKSEKTSRRVNAKYDKRKKPEEHKHTDKSQEFLGLEQKCNTQKNRQSNSAWILIKEPGRTRKTKLLPI